MFVGQLDASQLLRFESLGDNCEFGFVLRNAGCEFGGLFKWARSEPEQIAALLKQDFADSYLFGQLSPLTDEMVRDAAYGMGWHTTMYSKPIGAGRRAFEHDIGSRQAMWQDECRKMRYLETRFRQRLRSGGSIFVIKSNNGISPAALDDIHAALDHLAQGERVSLLEVCSTEQADTVGTVVIMGPGRMRGFISGFASYKNATPVDPAGWHGVLQQALHLQPCANWGRRIMEVRCSTAPGEITLAFPERAAPDFTQPVLADLRAGWPTLESGDSWCRKIEEGFRMHAPSPGQPPATLSWTGVRVPQPCHLTTSIACPIPDSLPVQLSIRIETDTASVVPEQFVIIAPDRAQRLTIAIPPISPASSALKIIVSANAVQPLLNGQRAVVDIASIRIVRDKG